LADGRAPVEEVERRRMAGRHRLVGAGDLQIRTEAWSVFLRERGVLDTAPDPTFDRWTRSLRRGSGAAVAALCLCDESYRFVKSVSIEGAQSPEVPLPVHLPPAGPLEEHLLRLTCPTKARPDTYAEAPVLTGGRVVGQVAIAGAGPEGWFPDAVELLHDTAAALSTQLALRLAKAEIERVQQLVASHHKVHDMIARAAPLQEVLTEICETIQAYDPAVIASVLLLDPVTRTLHSGVGPSLPAEYLAATEGVVIGPNIGTCGVAAWYGRLTVSPDLDNDPSWAPILHLARMADVASCWSAPIKGADGEVMGTLAFYGRQPREPVPEQLALIDDWARVAGIAIDRSRSQERLTHDACHDGLTGLPNRRAIFAELEETIQRATPERPAAVLFVDLDGLKALNDTHGHDRADEMIRDIAHRLAATVGDDAFVGRFGGDEFIVIVERLQDVEDARKLGARLLDAVAEPLPGLDAPVMTASIGVTLVHSDAVEAREAIRQADAAMYSAKRSGRDRCVIADTGRVVHEGRRLRLARELRGAETRGELSLLYQPVVALPTMEVVGVEALLRWTSPTLGTVPPSEFVPVAEDTGSIVPIGAWALRESCEAMASLARDGYELELGVNVSACQVVHPDFPLWVRKTLAHAQFPAHLLGLEITETALMRPGTLTARWLGELDELGVRLVLDDFGTGYSSLTWLKQHRFGAIKIDHSFVRGLPDDPGDRAIVAGVIDMARALGSGVTAEGVETHEQLAALRSLGCERVQGFLLMEPVGAHELPRVLRAQRPAFR
jgi:diguanylate cyclase (GGDEF)-like protein